MKSGLKQHNHIVSWLCASILGLLACIAHTTVVANTQDEAIAACLEAARLIQEDDDISGALEEANWCVAGIKQLNQEKTLSLLPDEVENFAGGEIENEQIMGLSVIKREYTSGDQSLNVSITTSTGEAGGLGGLGALAQLGAIFGGAAASAGGKQVRVQKRTVMASDEGDGGALNVKLKSGGTMAVESDNMDSEELLDFLRAFPLAELDDSMG